MQAKCGCQVDGAAVPHPVGASTRDAAVMARLHALRPGGELLICFMWCACSKLVQLLLHGCAPSNAGCQTGANRQSQHSLSRHWHAVCRPVTRHFKMCADARPQPSSMSIGRLNLMCAGPLATRFLAPHPVVLQVGRCAHSMCAPHLRLSQSWPALLSK